MGTCSVSIDREAFRAIGEEWRRGNVGRTILNAFNVFEQDVLASLSRDGYGAIRAVHLNLYRNLDLDGTRLTELARRGNTTKQSMKELVDRAAEMGFVERQQSEIDRRAKMVVFTDAGLGLLEALHRAVVEAERRMEGEIGRETVTTIGSFLSSYVERCSGRADGTAEQDAV